MKTIKSFEEFVNEDLLLELSSDFLKKAAHAAVEKGDERQVKLFMKGAKKAKKREDKEKEKTYISLTSYINVCSKLHNCFIKYGNLLFKKGWDKNVKRWISESGGSRYEGTDYSIRATYGIFLKSEYLKPGIDRETILSDFKEDAQKIIDEFYTKHPDPKYNFITKYEDNVEALKHDSWEVKGDRSKYFVNLSLPGKVHPYAFGSDIFGIICEVDEGDEHKTSNGGGLGMPATYDIKGIKYAPSTIIDRYDE